MSWSELLAELFFMPAIAFVVGLFMVLMMRKIAAKIQRRVGPPFFQPLYDIVKLYQKDTKDGIVNKLIYKYQKAFYEQVDANAQEGARSKQWLKDNVDLKNPRAMGLIGS